MLVSGLLGDWVLKLFPILISFISKIIQSSIFPSSFAVDQFWTAIENEEMNARSSNKLLRRVSSFILQEKKVY